MIKLFRNIRKTLLAEGKTPKYFKYAIGEIVLVVIGILIALQINTWNLQRIENKKEEELLIGLLDEFQYNLGTLEEGLIVNEKVSQACISLTQMIRSGTIDKDTKLTDELLVTLGTFQSFDARTGISDEIVNSGKISILKNDTLRTQLGNWLTLLRDSEEDILFRSDHYTMNLMPFLMKRFPLANGELTKKLPFDKKNYLKTIKKNRHLNTIYRKKT
ncbi:DUF6090 family protein [Psychroserpens ponticola]|uniref:DUF6090 family protein n=1 Tax=Psychroserpens ponticola TaxID=2932268 RepID=A0ABY7S097_9FLAO|nr:DUF6090 family protein [Psychroserpens ponticola]WCO02722.1 DUF6090 family protein [Psychroserpens ponticola]